MIVRFRSIGLLLGTELEKYLPPSIKLLDESNDEVVLVNKKTGELAVYSRETGKRLDCGWNSVSPEFIFSYDVDNLADFMSVVLNSLKLHTGRYTGRSSLMTFVTTGKIIKIKKVLRLLLVGKDSCSIDIIQENEKTSTNTNWYFVFDPKITGDKLEVDFKLDWEDT